MDWLEALKREDEKPLDHKAEGGGHARIFRKIAVIGDSLSSGEFESKGPNGEDIYEDFYEYSFGQYMARTLGAQVLNFSAGGMSAKEYIEHFADDNGFWDPHNASQAYIVALCANDRRVCTFGDHSDFDFQTGKRCADTFCGYYGEILYRCRKIEPESKLFLMTRQQNDSFPEDGMAFFEKQRKYLYYLAETLQETYVIDLHRYAPVQDAFYRENYFLYGHRTPAGYMIAADYIMSYIDFIVRHNMAAFKEIGLMQCMRDGLRRANGREVYHFHD